MTVISFEHSGGASDVTLDDVAQMALAHGFEKKGPQTPGKKAAQRADLQAFFGTYGVKAFSPFKQKFMSEKLLPPQEHLAKARKVSEEHTAHRTPPFFSSRLFDIVSSSMRRRF